MDAHGSGIHEGLSHYIQVIFKLQVTGGWQRSFTCICHAPEVSYIRPCARIERGLGGLTQCSRPVYSNTFLE